MQSALNALARKTLEPSETEEKSLVAALLNASKSTTVPRKRGARDTESMYMEQLRVVARSVLETYHVASAHTLVRRPH